MIYDLIKKAVLSEKSSSMAEAANKYTFKVAKESTKPQVAKSVEQLFDVKVSKVNIVNMKPQKVFFRGRKGKTTSYKKAIVTLENGYKIDLFGAA